MSEPTSDQRVAEMLRSARTTPVEVLERLVERMMRDD